MELHNSQQINHPNVGWIKQKKKRIQLKSIHQQHSPNSIETVNDSVSFLLNIKKKQTELKTPSFAKYKKGQHLSSQRM